MLGEDDWRLWRQVRLAALAEAPYAYGSTLAEWQGEGDREERWRDRLALAGSHNLVALVGSEAVGSASGVPRDGHADLVSMWVGPAARGGGLADSLVGAVEAWAVGLGLPELRLRVVAGNDRAVAFYLRRGFAFTPDPARLMRDGIRQTRGMAKPLRLRTGRAAVPAQ